MTPEERTLCEALDTYFDHSVNLGLPKQEGDVDDHGLQFMHEDIIESFANKVAELVHYDGIRAAFRKVHNYKDITDPQFNTAFEGEMKSQAVPVKEQKKALDAARKIAEEIAEDGFGKESDAGFHPDLDDVTQTSQEFEGYEE